MVKTSISEVLWCDCGFVCKSSLVISCHSHIFIILMFHQLCSSVVALITVQYLLGSKQSVFHEQWNDLSKRTLNHPSCDLCCIFVAQLLWDVDMTWINMFSSHQVVVHCPLWDWAPNEERRGTLKSWVAPIQQCLKTPCWVCRHPEHGWKPFLTVPALIIIRS